MNPSLLHRLSAAAVCALVLPFIASGANLGGSEPLSPTALLCSPDAKTIYVSGATSDRVLELDVASGQITRAFRVAPAPLGVALARDGRELFVTCAAAESKVFVINLANGSVARTFRAGHTAMAPVLSPDGRSLFVCNRFDNEVTAIDVSTGTTRARIPVPREPVAAAITPDGRLLFVANHIHAGRADAEVVAASVSVIDAAAARLVTNLTLVNGSGLLRGVAVSPDGRHVAVTHQVSRFHLPTTQIERGWINTAGLTLIDVAGLKIINTVLLDNIDRGAANPWAVAWSDGGKRLVATHAGTHDVSVIDAPALLSKLDRMPARLAAATKVDYTVASHVASDVPNDLSFLVGLRTRVKLPRGDHGPRAVVIAGARAFTANYFSDSLTSFELDSDGEAARSHALGASKPMSAERRGDFYFNDGAICFQGWQSCSSCHSSDARVDGMNWDNLNDGIGNPKNAKSLLLAFNTAPSMWLSVREDATVAVRAGIKHSLFTVQPPQVAECLDAYLKSLKPVPSPRLVHGKLSAAAQRGRKLFEDEVVGCTECHKGKFFTDLKSHDVGTRSQYDKPTDVFDTPTLIEVWRSAPYLHDGSAATVREVLIDRNANHDHGNVKNLSADQIADLIEYVLSL